LLLPFITDQRSFKVVLRCGKDGEEGICTGIKKIGDRYEGGWRESEEMKTWSSAIYRCGDGYQPTHE
jgi:hypothetical protein